MAEEDTKPAASEQIDPNLAVVDRMRDLAKWLIVVFGGIGGVLIAGTELADIGNAEGRDLLWAVLGVALGIGGAGLALAFTVIVLLPTGISLRRLADDEKSSDLGERVIEEPEVLYGLGTTIGGFKAAVEDARKADDDARAAFEADEDDETLKKAAEKAHEARESANRFVDQFINWALLITVKEKMIRAVVATFVGGVLVVIGIAVFSMATQQDDSPAEAAEAVPKQPSAVTIDLTDYGREILADRLGTDCRPGRLNAIALDGEPDALQLVSVPTPECEAVRFTLTESVGAVVSGEDLEILPTCPVKRPDPPCVVYR